MKLYAENMHFIGNEKEKAHDLCVHGNIVFCIDGDMLCDNRIWCVSASAYRFLHTLFENHFAGEGEHLIPCCGHFMVPSEDKKSVTVIGCNTGIDFDVVHKENGITVKTANKEYTVSPDVYKTAVLYFANQIADFYKANPAREFQNDFDGDGFAVFRYEFRSMIDKANI